jgi:hypothetical protein
MARKHITMKRILPWLRFQNVFMNIQRFTSSLNQSAFTRTAYFCTWMVNFTSKLNNGQYNCKQYE